MSRDWEPLAPFDETTTPYVELHLHSSYSLLDGASRIDELVWTAQDLGYRALALTDHNGMFGTMEFASALREAELHSITGLEVTVAEAEFVAVDGKRAAAIDEQAYVGAADGTFAPPLFGDAPDLLDRLDGVASGVGGGGLQRERRRAASRHQQLERLPGLVGAHADRKRQAEGAQRGAGVGGGSDAVRCRLGLEGHRQLPS